LGDGGDVRREGEGKRNGIGEKEWSNNDNNRI